LAIHFVGTCYEAWPTSDETPGPQRFPDTTMMGLEENRDKATLSHADGRLESSQWRHISERERCASPEHFQFNRANSKTKLLASG